MSKLDLKRIASPKSWNISRKESKYVVRPSPGSASIENGLPIGVILRDFLNLASNLREAKYIINNQEILINKSKSKDVHQIVNLMDIIEIPLIKKLFRVLMNRKGKLIVFEVPASENCALILKIIGVSLLKKGLIQLNLFGGQNLIVKNNKSKPGDTIIFDLVKKQIIDQFKLSEKSFVYLIGGKHVGESGIIEKIVENQLIFKNNNGERLETSKKYAYILGKDKSSIKLLD
jgi:small subunit ribosomal protein S4e